MADVVMYTASYCGYCRAAKRFLKESKGVEVREIDVTSDDVTRMALATRTGQTTVPQIYVGNTHVGGYSDLRALDAAGRLDRLLNDSSEQHAGP